MFSGNSEEWLAENIRSCSFEKCGNVTPGADAVPNSPQQVLSSWKEIAAYFGRGVRTVQRWERELQMPVHRPKSGRQAPVLAFANELEKWSRSQKIARSPEFQTQQVQVLLASLQETVTSNREELRRLREQTEQLKQLRLQIERQLAEATNKLRSELLKGVSPAAHLKLKPV